MKSYARETLPYPQNDSPARKIALSATARAMAAGFGCLTLLGMLAAVLYLWSSGFLDSTGWISHQLKTDVLIHHEWLPGEVRECEGNPKVSIMCSNITVENGPSARVWSLGDQHTFIVTYWGRVDRGISTDWNCTRGETDLTCKAAD